MQSDQGSFAARRDARADVESVQIAAQRHVPRNGPASKKKARPRGNAPSNKTYGNCLLGLHCSQKHSAESRANA